MKSVSATYFVGCGQFFLTNGIFQVYQSQIPNRLKHIAPDLAVRPQLMEKPQMLVRSKIRNALCVMMATAKILMQLSFAMAVTLLFTRNAMGSLLFRRANGIVVNVS